MRPVRKLVAFGGSAGSISGLCAIIRELPSTFEAALLAVIHTGEEHNMLAQVFERCTGLKIVVADEPKHLTGGCLFLAAPNRHLVVRDGCVFSVSGPRENRHRPSVDMLLRSAARAYNRQVIAVILSGALDDGTAGALAVKARGGTVIVEDPAVAEQPSMPQNVARYAKVDYSLPASGIAPVLSKLVSDGIAIKKLARPKTECAELLYSVPVQETEPAAFPCPDCGGALTSSMEQGLPQFRCHVGHIFSLQTLSEAETDVLERSLWKAYRKLKEHHAIQLRLAKFDGRNGMASRYRDAAAKAARDMETIQGILKRV